MAKPHIYHHAGRWFCRLDHYGRLILAAGRRSPELAYEALREQIKAASRPVQLIADEMQRRIRIAYSLEDEQYFSRIGVGAALGVYAFQSGEQAALLAFGVHVEAVRQWGKAQRAELGL